MAGNTIGSLFRVTTWGESHGEALGAVLDGCPAGLKISEKDIQQALDRRRPARNVASTTRGEGDKVEILSGFLDGKTTGTPITLLIRNTDAKSSAYDELKDVFRPGHGDFTYLQKYGIRDWRGGGRASGRETAARVAAGAIAEKLIAEAGMEVIAYTQAIGNIVIDQAKLAKVKDLRQKVRSNIIFCPDAKTATAMEKKLADVRYEGDTLGGVVEIIVRGCPAGLGEPVFDKMDADLAKALMSIGSVKAVEIGAGVNVASLRGSQVNDEMSRKGFSSNNAGGILAGITNGEDIVLRAYCKPVPSIGKEQRTINIQGKEQKIKIQGRHDVCVLPRVVPVCEAMVAIVLDDHLLRQRTAKI
jgi:chorismate synthase